MNAQDFEYICALLKQHSGLILSQDKSYLLESRLNPVARRWNFSGVGELIQKLRQQPGGGKLRVEVVEAMTTNESFFFRDQKPFDQFRDLVLPHLLQARARTRKIRIWSAACSSGQEPYSLAMLLDDARAKLAGWTIEIIATDLSHEILEKARGGLYTQFEVQRGLPIQLLMKHFTQNGDEWKISDRLRNMVTFKPLNLLSSFSGLGKFDAIFCRNVLIYFDHETKGDVLSRLSPVLQDDGFLFLGGAETVLGISDDFKLIPAQRGVYGLSRFLS